MSGANYISVCSAVLGLNITELKWDMFIATGMYSTALIPQTPEGQKISWGNTCSFINIGLDWDFVMSSGNLCIW